MDIENHEQQPDGEKRAEVPKFDRSTQCIMGVLKPQKIDVRIPVDSSGTCLSLDLSENVAIFIARHQKSPDDPQNAGVAKYFLEIPRQYRTWASKDEGRGHFFAEVDNLNMFLWIIAHLHTCDMYLLPDERSAIECEAKTYMTEDIDEFAADFANTDGADYRDFHMYLCAHLLHAIDVDQHIQQHSERRYEFIEQQCVLLTSNVLKHFDGDVGAARQFLTDVIIDASAECEGLGGAAGFLIQKLKYKYPAKAGVALEQRSGSIAMVLDSSTDQLSVNVVRTVEKRAALDRAVLALETAMLGSGQQKVWQAPLKHLLTHPVLATKHILCINTRVPPSVQRNGELSRYHEFQLEALRTFRRLGRTNLVFSAFADQLKTIYDWIAEPSDDRFHALRHDAASYLVGAADPDKMLDEVLWLPSKTQTPGVTAVLRFWEGLNRLRTRDMNIVLPGHHTDTANTQALIDTAFADNAAPFVVLGPPELQRRLSAHDTKQVGVMHHGVTAPIMDETKEFSVSAVLCHAADRAMDTHSPGEPHATSGVWFKTNAALVDAWCGDALLREHIDAWYDKFCVNPPQGDVADALLFTRLRDFHPKRKTVGGKAGPERVPTGPSPVLVH